MEPKITRLVRESNPPAGMLASPTPQIYDKATNQPGTVVGYNGAPASVLVDHLGNPISQSNPLEVRVRELEAELAAMRGMLETGDAKVTLTGQVALLNALSSPGSTWKGWGATVGTYAGTHPAPLDVSGYPRRLIHVRNDTNAPLASVRLNVYGESGGPSLESEDFANVPVGATLVIDGNESEFLDRPYPYISLRTRAEGSTEGTTYVSFFGGA